MNILSRSELLFLFKDSLHLFVFLMISIALSLIISWIYRITHKGFSYSQSFSLSLVLITVIVTMIIFLIEDSIARAVGIFGAFSIIRFRTAVKDVRDIAFIFYSLAIGMAVGLGAVPTAIMGVFVISILIFILHKTNFGGLRRFDYVLNFKADVKNYSENLFQNLLSEYFKKKTLLNVSAKERGKFLVFTFNVNFKNSDLMNVFLKDINSLEGVTDVNLISSKNDLEF